MFAVAATSTGVRGFMASVENFFANLFGASDMGNAGRYAEAVRRSGAMVTVNIEDEST
jgi:hypothetical protein